MEFDATRTLIPIQCGQRSDDRGQQLVLILKVVASVAPREAGELFGAVVQAGGVGGALGRLEFGDHGLQCGCRLGEGGHALQVVLDRGQVAAHRAEIQQRRPGMGSRQFKHGSPRVRRWFGDGCVNEQ